MIGMAQTLGTDVPFVTLTGSEVFSLEVSQDSSRRERADGRCRKRKL